MPKLLLASAILLLALPGTASAAVSFGQTTNGGTTCPADRTMAQTASTAPEYTVRVAGVVTELRTEQAAAAGRRLHVLRPRGNDAFTLLASVAVTPGQGVIRVPVRVPVQPGDVLGMSVGATPDPHPNCMIPGADGPYDVIQSRSGVAGESGDVTLPDQAVGRLNVAATLEPDGDSDGFGDETQDRCPDDPTRTSQDCAADLVISQTPVELDVERDDVNVLTIAVRNNGTSLARDVRVTQSLPPGVQLVATSPSRGDCAGGAPIDCTLPTLASGATGTVFVVVRTVSTGRKSLTARVESPTPDPNGANNTTEVEFDVAPRRSVTDPGAFCRVPRLKGLTRGVAKRALAAAGCRLGRTRGFRYGKVRRQSIPPRVRVATGTRVHLRMRRR